jgi:hypothetical protein
VGVPQLVIMAVPDQMREMVLPWLLMQPELLQCFMGITGEAVRTIKESGDEPTEH